jgi:hypothetical protein
MSQYTYSWGFKEYDITLIIYSSSKNWWWYSYLLFRDVLGVSWHVSTLYPYVHWTLPFCIYYIPVKYTGYVIYTSLVYIILSQTCFGSDWAISREVEFKGLYLSTAYICVPECNSCTFHVQDIVVLDPDLPVQHWSYVYICICMCIYIQDNQYFDY